MEDLYKETLGLLKLYGIKANKSLGQNFLINSNVLETIIKSSNITKDDLVIEIGPGLGTLTNKLIEISGKVICIEIDSKMIDILNNRFKDKENIVIINKDILKCDLQQIIDENKENYNKIKVVANLPYYITTPIIMKLLEDKVMVETITIMVQKEVAERLTAKPGDEKCGGITFAVNYYSKPETILQVSHEDFYPSPEVDSSIIKLNILKKPPINVQNEGLLFKIVKIGFNNRRKTLLNNIYNATIVSDKKKIKEILNDLGIDENRRGETLTLEEYEKLTNYLEKI